MNLRSARLECSGRSEFIRHCCENRFARMIRLQSAFHGAVNNPRFGKRLSNRREAMPLVKRARVLLRIGHDTAIAAFGRERDQAAEQRRAHTSAAPLTQHRHASDVAVGQQSAASDRASRAVLGDHVRAILVDIVPFDLLWHALLENEDGMPQKLSFLDPDSLFCPGP